MNPNPNSNPLRPTRRGLFRGTLLGVSVLAVSGCADLFVDRGPISTVGRVDFTNPVHIPPLAEARRQGQTRVFDLTLQAGTSAIVPQGETDTWGVNGPLLGPTLRVARGDQVQIQLRNDLPEASTLHWHGMRLPAAADGGPHQMVDPGATWTPTWTIDQPAATLWYHPHPHGATERHLYRGVVGLFILDDEIEGALDLPRDYGVDDVPLVVQDRTFDDTGALVETRRVDNGMLGETILVNGTAGPVLEAGAELTRLRLLNASAARTYNFGFSDDRTFEMIASDGGLLAAPLELTRIMLSPGERAEILVRLSPGEEVTLRSYRQDLGLTTRLSDRNGANDELDILLVRAKARLTPAAAIPAALAPIEAIDPATARAEQTFALGNNRINNQAMDMARIDAYVVPESVEIWSVSNTHTRPHNFHIHDVQFLILDRDGAAPPPELAGWKDTVYVAPGSTVRLIMWFGPNPDQGTPYMFHCHLLWHEDEGMMGQFIVGTRDAQPSSTPSMDHSGMNH